MELSILNILSIVNVLTFLLTILFTKKERNKHYLKYIIISYPLLVNYALPSVNSFVLITLLFLIFFYKGRKFNYSIIPLYKFLIFIFIIVIITGSILYGEKIDRDKFIYISEIASLMIYAKILIDEFLLDRLFIFQLINSIKLTLVLSFVFLLAQFIFGPELSLSRTMNPNIISNDAIRYPSFLSDPQVYAQFIGVISFICFIKQEGKDKLPKYNYILIILSLVAILITGARAGLTGLIIGYLFLILFSNSRYRIIMLITAGVSYTIALYFKDSIAIFNRGGDLNDTYDFRYSVWMDAFEIFKKYPLFGIGFGNYSKYVEIHNPDQFWLVENEIVYFDHPESGYLKFLTEFGLIGLVSIMSIFIFTIISSVKNFIKNKDINHIALISSIICWMVGFYSTFSFGDIRIAILVITVLCMLISLNYYAEIKSVNIKNNLKIDSPLELINV